MQKRREFVLIMALTSAEPSAGKVLLTGKFVDGMRSYAERWDGQVHAILPPGRGVTGNLDDVVVARDELPFSVDILPLSSPALRQRLLRAAVVMGQSHHEIADVASFCARHGVLRTHAHAGKRARERRPRAPGMESRVVPAASTYA